MFAGPHHINQVPLAGFLTESQILQAIYRRLDVIAR